MFFKYSLLDLILLRVNAKIRTKFILAFVSKFKLTITKVRQR
jgi:hypothetical protein